MVSGKGRRAVGWRDREARMVKAERAIKNGGNGEKDDGKQKRAKRLLFGGKRIQKRTKYQLCRF